MIPKIIWQTHKESYNKLPKHITDCSDTWKNFNPEYEYKYFDDLDMDIFIVEYFGQEWLDILNDCPIKIMKVDTFKYMLLYVFGGVYIDIDYVCNAPIDSWLKEKKDLIIFQDDNFLDFTQAVFASSKNNIILEKTIENIKKDLQNPDYTKKAFVGYLTGYGQFSNTLDLVLKLKNKKQIGMIKNLVETSLFGDIFDGLENTTPLLTLY